MNKRNTQVMLQDEDKQVYIDYYLTRKAQLIFRAINHTLRQQLISAIDEHKELTVTQLMALLRLEQSIVSQHLAILRKAGIVLSKKVSKNVFYKLRYEKLEDIMQTTKVLTGNN
jgi:DNA-binding transcriptional ArsR family regulator